MAIQTNVDVETWDFLNLRYGGRWPAEKFEVVDQNDDPIVGFTVKMQIRSYVGSSIVRKELTDEDGFTVVGNLVTFNTEIDIGPGVYVHDIEILLSGDTIPYTQYKGNVLIERDVTRPTPP